MYYDARSTHKSLLRAVQAEADMIADLTEQKTVDARAYWTRWHGVALIVASQRASFAAGLLADAPDGLGERPYGEPEAEDASAWYASVVYEAQSKLCGHASHGPVSRSTSPASNIAEDAVTTMAADILRDASAEAQLRVAQARLDRYNAAAADAQAKREAAELERAEAESDREARKREARRQRRLARKVQE